MKDLRQSPNWAKYLQQIGWRVEKINNSYIYLKHLPIIGWYAKVQRPEKLDKVIINKIYGKYRSWQFLIEPKDGQQYKLVEELGFFATSSPSLPSKTAIIDLKKSYDYLLKSFNQKTRYNVKLAIRKKVKIVESEDIYYFAAFWRYFFEKKRFPFFSQQKNILAMYKTFGSDAKVLFAKKDNEVIAGLFLLFYDRICYYMYAASDNEGRKNFAPTLLTWEAIKLAKKMKCKVFDFDGIYDERFPLETWKGFTKFKEGFKGKEIEYPGALVKTRGIIKL